MTETDIFWIKALVIFAIQLGMSATIIVLKPKKVNRISAFLIAVLGISMWEQPLTAPIAIIIIRSIELIANLFPED